jgi:hypothetical protein
LEADERFKQTGEYRVLVRCVDRVCKRFKRSKRHKSLDELKERQGFVPVDPGSIRSNFYVKLKTLLDIQRDGLGYEERLMLDLLRAETPHDEIARRLGMGRTKFFKFKKMVLKKIAAQLLCDD